MKSVRCLKDQDVWFKLLAQRFFDSRFLVQDAESQQIQTTESYSIRHAGRKIWEKMRRKCGKDVWSRLNALFYSEKHRILWLPAVGRSQSLPDRPSALNSKILIRTAFEVRAFDTSIQLAVFSCVLVSRLQVNDHSYAGCALSFAWKAKLGQNRWNAFLEPFFVRTYF